MNCFALHRLLVRSKQPLFRCIVSQRGGSNIFAESETSRRVHYIENEMSWGLHTLRFTSSLHLHLRCTWMHLHLHVHLRCKCMCRCKEESNRCARSGGTGQLRDALPPANAAGHWGGIGLLRSQSLSVRCDALHTPYALLILHTVSLLDLQYTEGVRRCMSKCTATPTPFHFFDAREGRTK